MTRTASPSVTRRARYGLARFPGRRKVGADVGDQGVHLMASCSQNPTAGQDITPLARGPPSAGRCPPRRDRPPALVQGVGPAGVDVRRGGGVEDDGSDTGLLATSSWTRSSKRLVLAKKSRPSTRRTARSSAVRVGQRSTFGYVVVPTPRPSSVVCGLELCHTKTPRLNNTPIARPGTDPDQGSPGTSRPAWPRRCSASGRSRRHTARPPAPQHRRHDDRGQHDLGQVVERRSQPEDSGGQHA